MILTQSIPIDFKILNGHIDRHDRSFGDTKEKFDVVDAFRHQISQDLAIMRHEQGHLKQNGQEMTRKIDENAQNITRMSEKIMHEVHQVDRVARDLWAKYEAEPRVALSPGQGQEALYTQILEKTKALEQDLESVKLQQVAANSVPRSSPVEINQLKKKLRAFLPNQCFCKA